MSDNDFIAEAKRKFDSINGWIDLGNYDEAAEELNNLHPKLKSTIEFCKAWIRIYSAKKAWTNVELMCTTLVKHAPDDPFGVLHLAEAVHQQGKHVDAISILGGTLWDESWRESPTVLYALARYFCAADQAKEGRECLRKAIEADRSLKKKALEDSDLEKIWIHFQK